MADWYFDVISPFAYLALPEVEAFPADIVYRPILFAGALKHWGQLGPAEIGPKRLNTYRLCVWEAERRGIPFRMPPTHPFNPLQALRLLTGVGATAATVRTTLQLVWQDGVDVGTAEGFARLGVALGVADPAAVAAGGKDALRAATDAAVAAGVFGVPTLALAGELFWGLDAMGLARAALTDPGLLTRGEMGRVATLPALQRRL